MAFLYVLDFDRHEMLRSEALLMINNFLILYNKEQKVPSDVEMAPQNSHVSRTKSLPEDNPIAPLVKLFEQSGFFDQLRELLDIWPHTSIGYRSALVELLLNLSILLPPSYMNMKLTDSGAWPLLVGYLNEKFESMHSSSMADSEDSALYEKFCSNQFVAMYQTSLAHIHCNVLHIVRLLSSEDVTTRVRLIDKTGIVQALKLLLLKDYQPVPIPSQDPLILACRVLADFLSAFFDGRMSELADFLNDPDFMSKLLSNCALLVRDRESMYSRRSACYLLSRLFSLHFGEIMFLDLDRYLDTEMTVGGTSEKIGILYCRELCNILVENYDPHDPVYMESVRLSLQCLLGRCDFAKNDAMKGEF